MTPRGLGLLLALLAYGMWGLSPLFWKQLTTVPSAEQLAHRVTWAALTYALLVASRGRLGEVVAALRDPGGRRSMLAGALLLGTNWGTYLYAVEHARIVEASLGYYLNPLVNVLLGAVVLGERLRRLQVLALALAVLGVGVVAVHTGAVPLLSLVLASSFGVYGLVRKMARVEALPGGLVEASLLALPALVAIAGWEGAGTGHFLAAEGRPLWLLAAGPFTALPVWLFAEAARRLPLSTMGFVQFLTPTMQLLLAVGVYGEAFTAAHAVAFGFIWAGVALFAWETLRGRAADAQPTR